MHEIITPTYELHAPTYEVSACEDVECMRLVALIAAF